MHTPDQQGRELEQLMDALQEQYPQVTTVMDENIANNEILQARIANRHGGGVTSRPPRPQPGVEPSGPTASPVEPPPATAAAPSGANPLR